jgi:hypothetical protein
MLEFIFFHQNICKLFTDFLVELNLEYRISHDDEHIIVAVAEDADDNLIEQLEDKYDQLLDLSRDQTDSDEGEHRENYQKASLLITLSDGSKSYAHVDMDILNRALRMISTTELNTLIEAVVDAVENPDDRSYCQIIKDGDSELN